ncbi:hypothetical protein RND71_037509 [Anisodus tanguticus]|uniref:Uncharacterized protein n=1 Tax=Anisodus tanguticus TaxID=243964 RepID=A0AAE1R387_9SOLA|nr:hypothetical protein RND71_037509 [Anisodus tanguticus]
MEMAGSATRNSLWRSLRLLLIILGLDMWNILDKSSGKKRQQMADKENNFPELQPSIRLPREQEERKLTFISCLSRWKAGGRFARLGKFMLCIYKFEDTGRVREFFQQIIYDQLPSY